MGAISNLFFDIKFKTRQSKTHHAHTQLFFVVRGGVKSLGGILLLRRETRRIDHLRLAWQEEGRGLGLDQANAKGRYYP